MQHGAALIVLLSTTTLPLAQDRTRLRGVVRDANQKPWAGATVVLHGRPVRGMDTLGDADRIEARSDERGRFDVRVLRNRAYLAWAFAKTKGTTYRVTAPAEGVRAGKPLRLAEASSTRVAPVVTLKVDASWTRPLSVKLTSAQDVRRAVLGGGVPRLGVPFVIDHRLTDDESLALPPLPWPDCVVEVYDAKGLQLICQGIALDAVVRATRLRARGKDTKPGFRGMPLPPTHQEKLVSADRSELLVPKGQPARLDVRRGSREGQPAKKARIVQRVRGQNLLVATAGDDGTARPLLPFGLPEMPFAYPLMPESAALVVQLDGFAEVDARDSEASRNPLELNTPEEKRREGPPIAVLTDSTKLGGRLTAAGQPLAGTPVFVEVFRKTRSAPFPRLRYEVLHTQDDGSYSVAHVGPETDYRVFAVLEASTLEACAKDGTRPFAGALVAAGRIVDHAVDLGAVDVTKLRRVKVQVRNPDGTPARDATLGLVSRMWKPAIAMPMLQPAVNRRGEVTMILASITKMTATALSDAGWATADLERLEASATSLELRIKKPCRLGGIVLSPGGDPLSGVIIQAEPADEGSNAMDDVSLFADRFIGRTDASGHFYFWMPGHSKRARLTMIRPSGGTIAGVAIRQISLANGQALDLELEMDPAKGGFGIPVRVAPAKRKVESKKGKGK